MWCSQWEQCIDTLQPTAAFRTTGFMGYGVSLYLVYRACASLFKPILDVAHIQAKTVTKGRLNNDKASMVRVRLHAVPPPPHPGDRHHPVLNQLSPSNPLPPRNRRLRFQCPPRNRYAYRPPSCSPSFRCTPAILTAQGNEMWKARVRPPAYVCTLTS